MNLKWYVVRIKPRADDLAARSLKKYGYEHLFLKVFDPHKQTVGSYVPMFPGYIFVRLENDGYIWARMAQIPGVLGLLRFGDLVPSIPDHFIDELGRRVEDINEDGGLWTRFKRGQLVRISAGKLEGLARVVDEPKSPTARVRVLMDFMGQMVSVQVSGGDLRSVETTGDNTMKKPQRRTRGRRRWISGFGSRQVVAV